MSLPLPYQAFENSQGAMIFALRRRKNPYTDRYRATGLPVPTGFENSRPIRCVSDDTGLSDIHTPFQENTRPLGQETNEGEGYLRYRPSLQIRATGFRLSF